jgi:4-amino-4-deoxy-L-arabinose transferase-like glycosyltransferase
LQIVNSSFQVVLLKSSARPSAVFYLCAYLLAAAIGLAVMVSAHSWYAGFSGADEPSHFLNGYFISHYIKSHLGSNPLAFATEYYVHYPKISIGNWPPGYYGVLALFFLVIPATYPWIFTLNVLLASLSCIGVAMLLRRLAGPGLALSGVVVYMCMPLVMEGQILFMVDQPLVACLLAAVIAWIAYVERQTWSRVFGFAALVALAILVKGNGWLAVLVPVWHMALTGRWRLMLSVKLWVAAGCAALAVVPWYVITAKIAAGGWSYQPGLPYAWLALRVNLGFLVANLSLPGTGLALFAIVAEWRARKVDPVRWNVVAGLLALLLATLVFQSIVPVDVVDRYVAPALPGMVVLALLGAWRLLTTTPATIASQYGKLGRGAAGAVMFACMLAPGVLHLAQRPPKSDVGAQAVAALIAPGAATNVTVVDGSAGYEGAMIATAAVNDPNLRGYIVRSSKILADSNYMGSSYSLKFAGTAGVLAELARLGVQNVVLVRARDLPTFPHSAQLLAALSQPGSGYHLRARITHNGRAGSTDVYQADTALVPNIALIRSMGLPSKVPLADQSSPGA